ncbi:MAG: hypothetical protein ACRD18_06475, partial [Terriglobia bacterium]
RTTPNYSLNTHAPDQTYIRPRHLQCAIDLAAPGRYYANSEGHFRPCDEQIARDQKFSSTDEPQRHEDPKKTF